MDWTLELVVVPVSDVDRAKSFYLDQMGFGLEVDTSPAENFRVVQMTPPGSACSIAIGTGIGQMDPGSLKGLHLCVSDVEAAHAELVGRGVQASAPYHFGESGRADGLDPERRSYATFFDLQDPDGNVWLVQEVKR